MGRRTLLVIASVLVAAVGTALIWVYVQGADARARRNWQEPVTVYVATETIEAGAARSVVTRRTEPRAIPRLLAPADRLTTLDAIGSRATTVPVLAGQYLIEGQFAAGNAVSAVPDGRMGLTVQMDDPNRVASLLRPDSHVAVYTVARNSGGRVEAQNLLPDVRVIGVGATSIVREADGGRAQVGTQTNVSTALVTLDVNGEEATRLMAYHSSLYFTLLGKGAKGSAADNFTTSGSTGAAEARVRTR